MQKWLIILVPTLITALAGISPVAFDYYMKWGGDLNFESVTSPSIRSGNDTRRVFSISVRNTGRTKLTRVKLLISPVAERVDEFSVGDRLNIVDRKEIVDGNIVAELRLMHPSEEFSISAMMISSPSGTMSDPIITLRSDETLGYERSKAPDSRPSKLVALSTALASSVVAVMSAFMLFTKRHFGRNVGRRESMIYVARLLDLDSIEKVVTNSSPSLTYQEFGSLALAAGLVAPLEVKANVVIALKAILLCPEMASESRKSVEHALRVLGQEDNIEAVLKGLKDESQSIRDVHQYREAVNKICCDTLRS